MNNFHLIEAKLMDLGYDVSAISNKQFPKLIQQVKVLGIHTVNPLGMAFNTYLRNFLNEKSKKAKKDGWDHDGLINAMDPDSDNDELYDGLELGFPNAWLTSGTNRSAGYFVTDENPNVYLGTDPTESDSDDDGILDGIEDADHNGAIDGDLDRDYVWDFDETWFETSPKNNDSDSDGLFDGDNGSLQQGEYAEDSDNDGIVDSDETDPIKFDSDGDGIGDGEELIPGEDGYVCDPIKIDTDGDGLTDGQEIKGWSVAIYKEATNEMIGEPWDVTSDPNDEDTDHDLVTDYEEFQHSSDPNNTDTDGDSIGDYAESCSSKNSITGFDGIAPSLTIDINTVKKGLGRYHMRITIWSSDMAGIDKVRICVRGIKSKTWQMYGESSGEKTLSFQKDWGRDLGDGYKILAQTWDVNGNFGEAKKEVPGITKRIVDFVMEIVEIIKEAVKALVNLFIDWIWKAIQAMMDVVLKPIKDGIESYVKGIANALEDYVEGSGSADKVISALFGSFAKVLEVLLSVSEAVFNIVKPFIDKISGLLDDANNFIMGIMTSAMGAIKNITPWDYISAPLAGTAIVTSIIVYNI